ncbi:MAG TPA: hypothetical protein DDX39_11995 [Bacteroidales bacterium]|nr:MAG: hypothetical protein A2W98_10370 [Bacteroidetes bacterium GWF2_33_38]HBF89353.1 hypothetical protein [Bacteroidales bacterium]
MIIKADSYFRYPPLNLNPKQVIVFNGIRYSIDIVEIAYERLCKNLYDFVYSENKPSFPVIFSECWTIINSATIFINLSIRHFKIDKENSIWDGIREIKELRNTNQHLDERINEVLLENNLPIYGALSWYSQEHLDAKEGVITTIISGSFTGDTNHIVLNPAGKKLKNTISGIEFSTTARTKNGFEIIKVDLEKIINQIKHVVNYFDNQLVPQLIDVDITDRYKGDLVISMYVNKLI